MHGLTNSIKRGLRWGVCITANIKIVGHLNSTVTVKKLTLAPPPPPFLAITPKNVMRGTKLPESVNFSLEFTGLE